MRPHRHFSVIDAVVVGYVADRTARQRGLGPMILVLLGIAAAYVHPVLAMAYAVLLLVCWALWPGLKALVRYFSSRLPPSWRLCSRSHLG
jgi:hypothetical protein